MPCGPFTSQSPFTLILCAGPPQCDPPRPQPLRITLSPGFQPGCRLESTTPAASMPATIGHLRTIGELLVIASASLKFTVEYETRRTTSPSGNCASSRSAMRALNASPSFDSSNALNMGRLFHKHLGIFRVGVAAPEIVLRLHFAKAARGAREFAVHHACGPGLVAGGRHQLVGRRRGRKHELHALG